MRWNQAVRAFGVGVLLLSLSTPLSGQGGAPQQAPSPRPWPPARTADGQPDVQGAWRPVSGGTHSLDPAKSGATDFEERISGVVKPTPSRIVDPPDGHIPYQPWARALQKQLEAVYEDPTKPEHIDTQTRCFVPGIPRLYYFPTFKILQPAGSVVFVWDEYHAFRVVPLDNRPRLSPNVKLWVGDARGRWEGNTLVVETTNLNDWDWFDYTGTFHTDAMTLTERFTVTAANTIDYQATVTDPKVFTRPWTFRIPLNKRRMAPGFEIMEHACVEGERGVESLLKQAAPSGR
jgi:hypothetical protein